MNRQRILVADHDPVVRFGISSFLKDRGYVVTEADDVSSTKSQLQSFQADAAVVDYDLADGDIASLVMWPGDGEESIPVIVLVAESMLPSARCLKGDFIHVAEKPLDLTALERELRMALDAQGLRRRSEIVRVRARREKPNPFLGTSAAIRKIEQLAHRILTSQSPILIQGETGTGKGVLARWIHDNGTRAAEEFHDLNCAGLSRELLESELFGHRRGAFTGAVENKLGLFDAANRSTLFLDEIGDMDLQVQAKLLKVLEERRFRRLGEVRERIVDVQLIAATHCHLEQLVEESRFRRDLYYRIHIVAVRIPPLRERAEDIPELVRYFVDHFASMRGRGTMPITASAMKSLIHHSWPGNIRELRNVLERAVLFANGRSIDVDELDLPGQAVRQHSATAMLAADRSLTLKELEECYIAMVLREENGSVERAARRLGIARSSLYNKLKPQPLLREVSRTSIANSSGDPLERPLAMLAEA